MKNLSSILALALVFSMSLATVPSYAKKDDDNKKENKASGGKNGGGHQNSGGGHEAHGNSQPSASSSSSVVSAHAVSSTSNSSIGVGTIGANSANNNHSNNNHRNNNRNNNRVSVSRTSSTSQNHSGNNNSHNGSNRSHGNGGNNNNNHQNNNANRNSGNNSRSTTVLATGSNRDHGYVVTTVVSNKGNNQKHKNPKDKDHKDKNVAHNPKDGGGKNKDKDKDKTKAVVATEPVPTHQPSSEELKEQLLALGLVTGYDGNISCTAKQSRDFCYTNATTKAIVDQYFAALSREENQRQIDKATEAAKELEKLGVKAVEDAPYGAKIVIDNGKAFITDSVGNKLTMLGFGNVDELQMQMRMWDIDPASFKEALDADLKKSEALVASGAWTAEMLNSVKERYDLAISSYERNPLVAYGNQFLLPASTFKNPDGSYQVPGTQKWIQNADKFGDAKSLLENESISGIGAHELYSRLTRELPFDFEKILASDDPLGAFRAAYSAYNTDAEWRKVETAWKNHMALVAGNKYVKVNHDVDTSGIVFDYAGNASGGVNTGSGFAGTGYEAGYLPGESTDGPTYPGVQGDEPLVYDNQGNRTAVVDESTEQASARKPASANAIQYYDNEDNVVDLTGKKQ